MKKLILLLFLFNLNSLTIYSQETIEIQDISSLTFRGEEYYDSLGAWISDAGDVNGDGIDDFLLGTDDKQGVGISTNYAYLIFGSTEIHLNSQIDLLSATEGFVRITNNTGPVSVSSLGDFNNDGFSDFIIGNHLANPEDVFFAGDALIIMGTSELPSEIDKQNPNIESILIKGFRERGLLGKGLDHVGDVNGDGFDDVLVSAYGPTSTQPGEAFLIFGGKNVPAQIQTPHVEPYGIRIIGEIPRDFLGEIVAGPGDVNGDGLPDILLSANSSETGVVDHTFLIYGATDLPFEIKLNELGNLGVDFFNDESVASSYKITALGDMNGDRLGDFLIAEPGAFVGEVKRGRVVLVFGNRDFPNQVDLTEIGEYGLYIDGVIKSQIFGEYIFGPGDLNLDGWPEILVGTISGDTEAPLFLIYNQQKLRNPNMNFSYKSLDHVLMDSKDRGQTFGTNVANIGDINKDGYLDFAFGERSADPEDRFAAGIVHIVFGRPGLFKSLLQKSDLNDDGTVNHEDLFLFQEQWGVEE